MNKLVLEQTIQDIPDNDLKYLSEIVKNRFDKCKDDIIKRLREAGFNNNFDSGDVTGVYQIYVRNYRHDANISAVVNVKYGQIGLCALSYMQIDKTTLQFDVSYKEILNAMETFNSYLEKMNKIKVFLGVSKDGIYEHGRLDITSESKHFKLCLTEPVSHTNTVQNFYYQCTYDKLEPISIQTANPVRIHDDFTASTDIENPDAKIGILLNNDMKNKLILIEDRLHFKSGDKFSKLSFKASDSLIERIKKKIRKL